MSEAPQAAGMKVIVVIADVVKSRQIGQRRAFQHRLEQVLEQLNAGREDQHSPYTITLGDEFQTLLKSPNLVFRDFFAVQRLLYPVRVRFSVGVGTLSTKINPRLSIGMDGPAFHLARKGLEEAKSTSALLRVSLEHEGPTTWMGPALDLLSHTVRGWKRNRLEVLQRMFNGQDTRAIAAAMEISSTAVYKNVQAGALGVVRDLCSEVTAAVRRDLEAK